MAYAPDRDRCASCLHFNADPDDPEVGECHRLPPAYMPRDGVWAFALVTSDNTCGEHTSLIPDHDPKSCH